MRLFSNQAQFEFNNQYTPNTWDIFIFILIFAILCGLGWAASEMITPYNIGSTIKIDLNPNVLPFYAARTVLRMLIAMAFSILATFIIAPIAAKNHYAEQFILPMIDILQSIPVLGMLSITIVSFISLFPNNLLGPECAAIFAIFTAQVWNMILSLYQSLLTVPKNLLEAAHIYGLSRWQIFWRVEVPNGIPGLIWNIMMSMSAGWFFVVYSEAIYVNNQNITLPGVGSYIGKAIHESNLEAIGYAIITMFVVIFLFDQLIFRPLLAWSSKFNNEITDDESVYGSWFYDLLAQVQLLKKIETFYKALVDLIINQPSRIIDKKALHVSNKIKLIFKNIFYYVWHVILFAAIIFSSIVIIDTIYHALSLSEILHVGYLGMLTGFKVLILTFLASILWIPIGVWIGLNSKFSVICQPIIQIFSAFPANLFYPLFVIVIIKCHLNHQVWTAPLMILGSQWYILFNIIAGAAKIPEDLRLASKSMGLSGWLWWKKFILPAIFPYFATGLMTTAGGCWNASIVAEFVEWGNTTFVSSGLGSYIEEYTRLGDFPRIVLGITMMCLYVILFNRLIWQKLYNLAKDRYRLD